MNGYPYFNQPKEMSLREKIEETEYFASYLKAQEEKDKLKDKEKKEKERPKPKTFTFIELFTLLSLSSLIIGPAVGLMYVKYVLSMLQQYGPIIQLLSK